MPSPTRPRGTERRKNVSPDWRALLLSAKSRDELLSDATKQAKTFLIGGAAAFAVGSLIAIVGELVGS